MNDKKIKAYIKMAEEIAKLSPDKETKVGAIMLSSEDRIIASSYNGFLRGANDDSLPQTRPDKYMYMQHAERNLIYNCSYNGIKTKDSSIICTLSPCKDCLRAAYQSGVKKIIFKELYHKFKNTDFYEELKDVHVIVVEKEEYTILELFSAKYVEFI